MRRWQSSFELEVFERRSGDTARLDEYLNLYIQYFSPHHRTDSNQLRWYLRNPISGRRIIYFGLSRLGDPCGFAVLMYYPRLAVGVFDFAVIAPNRRGHGAFFELCNQIADFIEAERITINYLVAEVLMAPGPVSHATTPKLLMRLLRFERFRLVKLPYRAPDPELVRAPDACRAGLMLALEPDRAAMPAEELTRIVELIYFDHYLKWYGPLMDPDKEREYRSALEAEFRRFRATADAKGVVKLNGLADLDVALEHEKPRSLRLGYIGLTGAGLAITIGVGLWQSPIVAAPILLVAGLATGAALVFPRARQGLKRAYGLRG